MNSLELFLLLLFIVIIYLVVVNKLPSDMLLGAIALWFTIMWIGFDNSGSWDSFDLLKSLGIKQYNRSNMFNKKYLYRMIEPQQKTLYKQSLNKQPIKPQLKNTQKETSQKISPNNTTTNKEQHNTPSQVSDTEFEKQMQPIVYSEENYKYNMFDELGSLGDNALAHKMKQTSNLNRQAIDNFSRMQTKNSTINYFAQELKESENMHWWENEELEDEF